MRYFICPSNLSPRLCAIAASTMGYTIVWTVFDFMEQKNSVSKQTLHKSTVDGFIANVLTRLQKFKEVDEISFAAFLQQAMDRSERLAHSGTPQTIWAPSASDDETNADYNASGLSIVVERASTASANS